MTLEPKRTGIRSTSIARVRGRCTILEACQKVLRASRKTLAPADIARKGIEMLLFEVPRGRTFGYLSQLVQSTLYGDAHYASRPSVSHGFGGYRIRR